MAENNQQTINEEAGLPDNFVPIDAPPIIPGSPISDGSSKYLQGSLPPQFQHDASFVGTGYASRTPNLSLMPLGIQGNPSSNAAVQSTSQRIVTDAIAAIPPAKPAAPSVGDGLIHGDAIWELDPAYILLRDDFTHINNGSGQITASFNSELPWYFIGPQSFAYSGGPPNLGVLVIPNNASVNGSGGASFLTLQAAGVGGGVSGNQAGLTTWALFDYPSWKMIWEFEIGRPYQFGPSVTPPAFSFSKTSLYIGVGNFSSFTSSGLTTSASLRPPCFIGLRFDTDATAPAISDTQFVFEAVTNGFLTAARNNAQGNTFATGIIPTEGVRYRLEMLCTTAGKITLSLFNGSTSVSASLNVPAFTFGSVEFALANGIGAIQANGSACPFGPGSLVTISGATGGATIFNGVNVAVGSFLEGGINTLTAGSLGAVIQSATMSGNPGVWPWISFGNDGSGSPTANSKALFVDYFGFVWNPGVGGGTGTPSINKSRYF
jgi:hypothetical protein